MQLSVINLTLLTGQPTKEGSYLIAGLGLWTGSLDWTAGLDHWMTFELNLCVSHDLHPIRCADDGVTYLMLSS